MTSSRPRSTPLLQAYRVLSAVVFVLGFPYLLYRRSKHPDEMRERWGQEPSSAVSGVPATSATSPPAPGVSSATLSPSRTSSARPVPTGAVWIHAASLGEVEAVRAWMEDRPLRDGVSWFVTVTSTSARRRAPERLGPEVAVRFAPLDQDGPVRRFLARHEPRALILVETELWPITLDLCRRAGVPVYIASGRISPKGWSTMAWARSLYREVASAVRAAAVQGNADEERFAALGIAPTCVCGNVKYRVPGSSERDDTVARSEEETRFRGLPIWVIGSLRKGEELLLRVAREVGEQGGYVVIAPRHLRERSAWVEACRKAGVEPVLRSETPEEVLTDADAFQELFAPPRHDGPRVLLVDVHGELRSWYARAAAASVGGTWMRIGGHNLFEPLSVGVPVSFGPYIENVRDVADAALIHGGGFQTSDPAALREWVQRCLDRASRQKTERSALHTARVLAGAGERTRACLSAAEAAEVEGGIFRP